jgi:uncharacterized protein (TIGR02594 family)
MAMSKAKRFFTSTILGVGLLSGCSNANNYAMSEPREFKQWLAPQPFSELFIQAAQERLGYTETTHRADLRQFMGVDPRRTEWCAAYLNAVLYSLGHTGSTNTAHPLLAQSFLEVGTPVTRERVSIGDIVVFSRGSEVWQGHVGIFMGETLDSKGRTQWLILGGNQDNSVGIHPYSPRRVLGVRRLEGQYYASI